MENATCLIKTSVHVEIFQSGPKLRAANVAKNSKRSQVQAFLQDILFWRVWTAANDVSISVANMLTH